MKHFQNHVAVWMDHHIAHFIFPKNKQEYEIESMESSIDNHLREDGQTGDGATFGKHRVSNNEYGKHNKEKNQLHEYYQTLKSVLSKYDEILLFGPTTAKEEFFNILFADKSFDGKRIEMESADKMSEGQMVAYAKNYFGEPQLK